MSKTNKFNMFESVNERIIAALEEGTIPWKKSWSGGVPKNLLSGKAYRGINPILLSLASEFSSADELRAAERLIDQKISAFVRSCDP